MSRDAVMPNPPFADVFGILVAIMPVPDCWGAATNPALAAIAG
jgi:hypothetical protein